MLRSITTALAALAISFPLSALAAGTVIDQKTPEVAVVAASEDAVILPAGPAPEPTRERSPKARHRAPHGSSQSEAGYRFTNPYSVPQQTLPLTFPAIATFSF